MLSRSVWRPCLTRSTLTESEGSLLIWPFAFLLVRILFFDSRNKTILMRTEQIHKNLYSYREILFSSFCLFIIFMKFICFIEFFSYLRSPGCFVGAEILLLQENILLKADGERVRVCTGSLSSPSVIQDDEPSFEWTAI